MIGGLSLSSRAVRDALFENLHGECEISLGGFADQEMEVFRHDHVAPNNKLVFLPDFFQDFEKQITATRGGKKGLTMVTTAGDEVFVAAGVKPPQTLRHGGSL